MAEISKREDVNPKEGVSQYGDVQFADEKNKKYPIDTEEHIRAAWNYINKEGNAGKYDPDEVATIKRKIIAAWKEKIDKDGPPSAEKMAEIEATKIGATFNAANREHLASIKESAQSLAKHAKQVSDHADNILTRTSQMMPDPSAESEAEQYPAESGEGAKTGAALPLVENTHIAGAIKIAGDWALDVLGVPFGGPVRGRDAVGERFTPSTKIHQDLYPEIPAFYYHSYDSHGNPQGDPVIIGKATYDHADERGHWYKVILDQTKEFAARVWEAAKNGVARASSGSIAHILRKTEDGDITNWPVVEMSLMDDAPGNFQAANGYAVALPAAKAAYQLAGLKFSEPSAPDDADAANTARSTGGVNAVQSATNPGQGAKKMTDSIVLTKEELQKMLSDAAAEGIKGYQKAQPAPDTAGVHVTLDEADRPFRSLAEMAKAVKVAEVSQGRQFDKRLQRIRSQEEDAMKASGANESIPADAGYLVEPTISKDLITPIHETGVFSSLVQRLPVSANSNFGYINGIDETSRATGSRWGGVRGYRLNEGAQISSSRPKFRRINWELKKFAALMYATDELIMDTSQFNAVANQSAGEEIAFMVNDDILNGLGVGGPQGVLISGALVSVIRTDVNKISHADVVAMWQRVLPRNKKNSQWFCNSDVLPQLQALYFAGSASVLSPYVRYGEDGELYLFGKKVNETEFNPALGVSGGSTGDLLVADFGDYLYWDKGDVQAATSIHIAFLTDEQAFRFIYRCDGQTAWASPITPYKAGATVLTQSAFVALKATST